MSNKLEEIVATELIKKGLRTYKEAEIEKKVIAIIVGTEFYNRLKDEVAACGMLTPSMPTHVVGLPLLYAINEYRNMCWLFDSEGIKTLITPEDE